MTESTQKRELWLIECIGFTAVSVLGTLLHFLYDWTGNNFVALFSAVNESTWEHMKLFFFPTLLFAVVQYFLMRREYSSFWCVKLKSTLLGLTLIPVLFYTISGAFGTTPDWINILIFFVSTAAAFLLEWHLFKVDARCSCSTMSIIALACIAVLFFVFTFYPPTLPLFRDPLSGTYGI